MNFITLFNLIGHVGFGACRNEATSVGGAIILDPCAGRERISVAADWATKNRRSASALRPSADAIIGLRPTWSDRRATVRKAAIIVKE